MSMIAKGVYVEPSQTSEIDIFAKIVPFSC